MLTVWIRLGQRSVGSDLGLCLQRLTADNKILCCQAKTINEKIEVWALSKGKNDWKRLFFKDIS